MNIERLLDDCVNELCALCGRYVDEHDGSCDQCRWLAVKYGEYDDE